jgi:preprotein translocase subunit Sec61beta
MFADEKSNILQGTMYFRRPDDRCNERRGASQTMSKKKNAPMPASSAGLLRFFEDETEGVKIRPQFVLMASMALIVGSIVMNALFR